MGGLSTLYLDVSEDEWKPLFRCVAAEPWDEIGMRFLRALQPFLDPALPESDREETVCCFVYVSIFFFFFFFFF
jgi:hypothetical protein